jgi:arylsulfatase A-like enzyme
LVKYIQNQNQKFFIHWAPYAVHTPIMGPAELIKKYKEKTPGMQKNPAYAALVENLDQNVGKVLAELDRLGLTEKTLVIFTSDNGGLIGNPANPITNNYPLRSQKGYPYEGGIRVPTLVKWPGKVLAGEKSDFPIVTMDWIPTILGYLGQNPNQQSLDGISLASVLASKCGLIKVVAAISGITNLVAGATATATNNNNSSATTYGSGSVRPT